MRICLISREYPMEKHIGGLGTYTYNLAHYLAKKGHKVHVICKTENEPSDYKDGKVNVYAVRAFAKPNKKNSEKKTKNDKRKKSLIGLLRPISEIAPEAIHNIIYAHKFYKKFKEIDNKHKIDIIESEEALGFVIAKKKKKAKFITRLHTSTYQVLELNDNKNIDMRIEKVIEKKQLLHSDAICSNSYALRRKTSEQFKILLGKIDVIHLGIDINEKIKYSEKSSIKIEKPYIFYFGSMEERKGIITLGKALPNIFKEHPKMKLVMCGAYIDPKNPVLAKFNKETQEYKDRLILLGFLSDKYLMPVVKEAELVVLPSHWEAFGYTCLESLALGKIVVASKGSGFEEQIQKDGENGYLFTPRNHRELAQKINQALKLTDKEKQKIQENAKKRAQTFDNEKTTKQMLEYYKKILHD